MIFHKIIAAGALCLAMAVPALAQDKMDLTAGMVEQLDVVSKLTNYGIERNDPLLLIAAARMLGTMSRDAAATKEAMGAAALIAKAKETAAGDDQINALADSVQDEASRGLCYNSEHYGCF